MQGELFKDSSRPGIEYPKPSPAESWLNRFRITLRIDHLSVIAISALILYVLIFSFGVEKGKRMAFREQEAEQVRQKKIAEDLQEVQTETSIAEPALVSGQETSEPAEETMPVPAPTESGLSVLTGKYTIQTITFTSRPKAEEEIKKLKAKGYRAFMIPSGKFFPVCVEAFETMSEAKEKLRELQSEGLAPDDAYVRPLKKPVTL